MPGIKMHPMDANLIAPCGINCAVCRAHLRPKNSCPGCRADDAGKAKTCVLCKIKTCEIMRSAKLEYCTSGCDQFPCGVLLHLDKRYRTKYGCSPVENLLSIQKQEMSKFLRKEVRKWTCPQCGELLCMHDPLCPACGYAWHAELAST